MNYDLVIFVEDPGAANFIIDFIKKLIESNYKFLIIAKDSSIKVLNNFGIKYSEYSRNTKNYIYSNNLSKIYLVGTSEKRDCEGLKVIEHCNNNNIYSISFIDMSINLDLRYKGNSKNPLQFAPNHIFVIDKLAKSVLVNLGFNKNNITVVNHPVVGRLRKYFHRKNKNINSIKKIVFIDEGIDKLNLENTTKNNNYFFHGTGNSINRTIIIFEELLLALTYSNIKYELIIRLHPNNDQSFYSEYYNCIDQFSKNTNPYSLIADADIVVGMTSMLLYETSFINKNHFSIIAQESEKGWLPSIAEKRTKVATNRSMISEYINLCISGSMKTKSSYKLFEKNDDFSISIINLLNEINGIQS